MRILLSGGGTAGHIYPALSVAARLAEEGHEITFAGTPDDLEAKLVPEAGVAFRAVRASGFDRAKPLSLLTSAVVIAGSTWSARRLLREMRADVVFGFGGYVSLPVGLAAVVAGVPLVLHEQNSVPGLANRVLSRWARAVGVTYDDSLRHLVHPERGVVTGNPVRKSVLDASRSRGRSTFGLDPSDTVLLVFGGSRGARHINDTMVETASALMQVPALQVMHVAGRIEAASVAARVAERIGTEPRYRVVDYIDAMGDAIAAADLVVARAGATSIAEITAIGRPALLVPYPYATDDHQTINARTVALAGGAAVIADEDLGTPLFQETLMRILRDGDERARMASASAALGRRDATERVASLVSG